MPSTAPRIPIWIHLAILLGSFLMALGAILALVRPEMLVGSTPLTSPARVFAAYFAARNLVLPLMLLVFLFRRSIQPLAGLTLTVAVVQLADAVFDIADGRYSILPGVALIAIAFFLAANRLFRLCA